MVRFRKWLVELGIKWDVNQGLGYSLHIRRRESLVWQQGRVKNTLPLKLKHRASWREVIFKSKEFLKDCRQMKESRQEISPRTRRKGELLWILSGRNSNFVIMEGKTLKLRGKASSPGGTSEHQKDPHCRNKTAVLCTTLCSDFLFNTFVLPWGNDKWAAFFVKRM